MAPLTPSHVCNDFYRFWSVSKKRHGESHAATLRFVCG
jgi:hypothetical protein